MTNVTVIVTCWKRFDHLEEIIDAWLAEPEVAELILFDNSPTEYPGPFEVGSYDDIPNAVARNAFIRGARGDSDRRVWVIRSSRNYGSSARYGLATLAANEVLLFGDDDVMPHPGLVADLLAHYTPERMVGVKGRIFRGQYHGNVEVRGEGLVAQGKTEPVEVDMLVGHIMLCHRNWLLGYNFADAAWYCCELQLQGRIKADVQAGERSGPFTLWVAPTDKHHDTEAQTDGNALYRQAPADAEKIQVYNELFHGRPYLVGV